MKINKLILNLIIAVFFGLLSFHSNAGDHQVRSKAKYSKKVKKAKNKKSKKVAKKAKRAAKAQKAKKAAPPAEENSDMDSDAMGEDF